MPDEPFVLHLANVMHLATDVRATVADGASSLALVASLHPSAAVCGTPTAPRRSSSASSRAWTAAATPVRSAGSAPTATASGASRCAAREVDADDPRSAAPVRRLRHRRGLACREQELVESAAKLVPVRDALQG